MWCLPWTQVVALGEGDILKGRKDGKGKQDGEKKTQICPEEKVCLNPARASQQDGHYFFFFL